MRITALFLLLFTINLLSQNETDVDTVTLKTELSELTVIGSIRADEDAPVPIKDLNYVDIESMSYGQELPIFLNNTQSITTTSDAGSYYGYTYFRLRGIDQTRINFTLNGIPLNEPEDQGAYFNNFVDFMNSVESVQIQRGVGTSTNGVASFGGSINFQAASMAKPIAEFQYGLASYGTNRYSLKYCTGIKNNYSIYARYSDVHSDGYKYHSQNDSRSFYLSSGLFYNKDIITYTGFYGHQKNQMAYLATSIVDIEKDPRTNYLSSDEWDNFKYLFNSVQYTTERIGGVISTTSLYYIKLDGNYDYFYSPDMYNYRLNSNFYGVISNVSTSYSNFKFDAGVHFNWYDRQHTSIVEPIETNLYDNTGYKTEQSMFIKLSYNLDALTLYADGQFRMVQFTYEPDVRYNLDYDPIKWTFFNPKFGLSYRMSDNIIYYASIGMTEREPTRLDMLKGSDDIDTFNMDEVGSLTSIKPEKVIDIEVGAKFKYDRFRFNINAFTMYFTNEIVATGEYSEVYFLALRRNVPKSRRNGIELDVKWQATEQFSIENNTTSMTAVIDEYTTVDGTFTDVEPLITPNIISNTRFEYDLKLFSLSLTGKYVSKSYLDNENTVRLPQYFVWNFAFRVPMYSHYLLDVRINNITDLQYYGGGYVGEPGVPYYFVQMPLNYAVTFKVRI